MPVHAAQPAPPVSALSRASVSMSPPSPGAKKPIAVIPGTPAWNLAFQLGDVVAQKPEIEAPALSVVPPVVLEDSLGASLVTDPNVLRVLMNPNRVRTKAYQRYVDELKDSPVYRTHQRDVRNALQDLLAEEIANSEIEGTTVTAENKGDWHIHPYTEKLYDLIQETAQTAGLIGFEGGPEEVELKLLSDTLPNAYVYGIDADRPRVHVYDAIVGVFFDTETDDWISEDAKLILQSVIAHELWHIKDRPYEWENWFGILVERSGIMDSADADGPLFTKAEKNALISKAKSVAREIQADEGNPARGFYSFLLNERRNERMKEISKQIDISPEEATEVLLRALGSGQKRHVGIEKNADGQPTRFGIAQTIFQDSFELQRAGEIAADRGAFTIQGTHRWTALIDMMLGRMGNFNQFQTSAQKRRLIDGLVRHGYRDWAAKQAESINEYQTEANLRSEADKLYCVSHPPSLPRVLLGERYMDRFDNPDAYPMVVQRVLSTTDPLDGVLTAVKLLHAGLHNEVTRFVDPNGYETASATAQTLLNVRFTDVRNNWERALENAYRTFDEVISDDLLRTSAEDDEEDEFQALLESIKTAGGVVGDLNKIPVEGLTEHLILRIESLRAGASTAEREVLESREEAVWKLHESQLKMRSRLFKPAKAPTEVLSQIRALLEGGK